MPEKRWYAGERIIRRRKDDMRKKEWYAGERMIRWRKNDTRKKEWYAGEKMIRRRKDDTRKKWRYAEKMMMRRRKKWHIRKNITLKWKRRSEGKITRCRKKTRHRRNDMPEKNDTFEKISYWSGKDAPREKLRVVGRKHAKERLICQRKNDTFEKKHTSKGKRRSEGKINRCRKKTRHRMDDMPEKKTRSKKYHIEAEKTLRGKNYAL